MSKNIFYVYVYLDPSTGPCSYGRWKFDHEPFYVGKGKSNRSTAHLWNSRNAGVRNKVKKLRRLGYEPLVVLKRKNLAEKEAFRVEKILIERIGRRGLGEGPLFNCTEGGDGFKMGVKGALPASKKALQQRSESLKAYWASVSVKEKEARVSKMRASWNDPKKAEKIQALAHSRKAESRASLSPAKKKLLKDKERENGKRFSSNFWNTASAKAKRARAEKIALSRRGKSFTLISPRGTRYTVTNLTEFCRGFSTLTVDSVRSLQSGQTNSTGWMRK